MDYRQLDLNLLVILNALFEEGGVNACARKLGISQPNVSFALAKLRTAFKDDLLIREGNRMKPTSAGERLRDPIRRILATVDAELLHAPVFDPAESARRFTISTSDIGELTFLPKLLAALAVRAPGTTLRCYSMRPEELERSMAEGTVDVALGYFPDLDGAALYRQKLFEHPFVCIVRSDHPDVAGELTLEQFLSLGHIVVAQEGRSQELVERTMRQQGLSREIKLQSPHFMSAPLLIARSDLITTVPRAVGTTYAGIAGLRLLQPPIAFPPIDLQQFWHRRVHSDPAVRWFRALVAELFLGKDPTLPVEKPGKPATAARRCRKP